MPFTVSKDEWNTKEDIGKALKNALHVRTAICQKAPLVTKQCQTVKKSSL